jgi:hypothetical protein
MRGQQSDNSLFAKTELTQAGRELRGGAQPFDADRHSGLDTTERAQRIGAGTAGLTSLKPKLVIHLMSTIGVATRGHFTVLAIRLPFFGRSEPLGWQ